MIHPAALVHPGASLHPSVKVGPFCVIDEHVTLGEGCRLEAGVRLTGRATFGRGNSFHTGCVIGDAPQDLKYRGEPTRLRVGDRNVFREHATAHRANNLTEETLIGSDNLLMAGAHVGHNAVIGDGVILANGALVGGHAVVGDRAFLSGCCLAHQFVRIGALVLMQGGAAVSLDVPPYTIAAGVNRICGLNVVGLRRAGFGPEERRELKRLYRALFLGGESPRQAAARAAKESPGRAARVLLDFILSGRRGLCRHGRAAGSGKEAAQSD
jgi:UDP-N-acetylglucosamine acyltransferase